MVQLRNEIYRNDIRRTIVHKIMQCKIIIKKKNLNLKLKAHTRALKLLLE